MKINPLTDLPPARLPRPAVNPGAFPFAAIGLAHGHIGMMCTGLVAAGATLIGSLTAQAAVNYSFNTDTLWDTTPMVVSTVASLATGGQGNANVLGGAITTDITKLIQTFQVTGNAYTVTDLYILTDDYQANAVINFRIVALG